MGGAGGREATAGGPGAPGGAKRRAGRGNPSRPGAKRRADWGILPAGERERGRRVAPRLPGEGPPEA